MKGILGKAKALIDSKKLMSVIQLALFGAILFVSFSDGLINEIKYVLEVLNVKNADKVLYNTFMLYKTLFEASQLYTIISITVKVLLSCIAFIALIVLFFAVSERRKVEKTKQQYSSESIITANYAGVYITQSKFLC
jgi:Na+-transporting NADH:ubiquinone oxidoreductase subunit NqrB